MKLYFQQQPCKLLNLRYRNSISSEIYMMTSDPCPHYSRGWLVRNTAAALTWAEFRRWLRWLGEWDFIEPLEEEVMLLMLHMLDLRDPIELGELGGECWKQKSHHGHSSFKNANQIHVFQHHYMALKKMVHLNIHLSRANQSFYAGIGVSKWMILVIYIEEWPPLNCFWDILVKSSTHYCCQSP